MSRPETWGAGPLTIMVIGRVGSQIETELFDRKIKAYLEPNTYTIHRAGGTLQYIEHKQNGNRMLFFSHHNIVEAREKVQAFTTHFIWLDEMADSASFINELKMRLATTGGRMIATFTPLVKSDDVRRMVDTETKFSVKYKLSMMDNPILREDPDLFERAMAEWPLMTEAERNTRLNGDWYMGDTCVYTFDRDLHVEKPQNYQYSWRHVLSVDPAMSGNTGVSMWAEQPQTGIWFCVDAYYTSGLLSPLHLVDEVEKKHQHVNIIRRVCDPHENWYITTAATMGFKYLTVFNKSQRKKELIKNLQKDIDANMLKVSPNCTSLIDEFISCQYSDTNEERIVNSSKYHLLDTAQYFNDLRPKFEPIQTTTPSLEQFERELRQANKAKKQAQLKIQRKGKRKSWKSKRLV